MRKFLLSTVALIAVAADLAARPYTKAPAMIVTVYDWNGFYVGANGGWGSSRKCWDFVTPAGVFLANEGCHDATGGTAGGQVGYRWQSGTWVVGVEAQGNWADFRGSNVSLAFPATRIRSKIDAFGLFTGQVGYAANDVLLYVKGGAAVTADRFDITTTAANALVASANDDTRWGGVLGIGLEYGFAPNWSAAIEYDHLFMQSHHQLHHAGRCLFHQRTYPPGCRSRHRPRQLSLGWPGRRQVLISAKSEHQKPRHRSGLFLRSLPPYNRTSWAPRASSSGPRKSGRPPKPR